MGQTVGYFIVSVYAYGGSQKGQKSVIVICEWPKTAKDAKVVLLILFWQGTTNATGYRNRKSFIVTCIFICLEILAELKWKLLKNIHIRAVAVTKWSSEPLIEVVSNCRKITLRPVLSKLVFLYYIFSSLEPLQLAGPSACVRSPASWRGSGLEKSY